MSCSLVIRGKRRKLCAKDLDRVIQLLHRSIVAPTVGDTNYTESFVDDEEVLAMIMTKKGVVYFDDITNLDRSVDIEFYIRFLSGVTTSSWINFEGDSYEILHAEDLDKRHEWLRLSCSERGNINLGVNHA